MAKGDPLGNFSPARRQKIVRCYFRSRSTVGRAKTNSRCNQLSLAQMGHRKSSNIAKARALGNSWPSTIIQNHFLHQLGIPHSPLAVEAPPCAGLRKRPSLLVQAPLANIELCACLSRLETSAGQEAKSCNSSVDPLPTQATKASIRTKNMLTHRILPLKPTFPI